MNKSAYQRYLDYAKDSLSNKEYQVIINTPQPFIDITKLAYAHTHTCEIFRVPKFNNEYEAGKMLRHYANAVEDFRFERFVESNTWLCAHAFLFYLDLIEQEGI